MIALNWPAKRRNWQKHQSRDAIDAPITGKFRAYFIISEYPKERFANGRLGARGTVELKDGTAVDWYLWEGERPSVHSHADS